MLKTLKIKETAGIPRNGEAVRTALPCARGEIPASTSLWIIDPAGQPCPSQFKVLKQWPDGSAKWLLVDFKAHLAANAETVYRLTKSAPVPAPVEPAVQVHQGQDNWVITCGAGRFILDTHVFLPFRQVQAADGQSLQAGAGRCFLRSDTAPDRIPLIENVSLEDSGPLHAIVRMAGRFDLPKRELRFSSRLHFFSGSRQVQIEFTLHNPQAASHPANLWDLGDTGSVLFRGLSFVLPCFVDPEYELRCMPEPGAPELHKTGSRSLCLYQESSGGENWRSPNHRNRDGHVPLTIQGYLLECDGIQNFSGLRATPRLWCGNNRAGIAVAMPRFWQEFPKALAVSEGNLTVSLFPARFPDLHELQGGEQKTHRFMLDFSDDPCSLDWSLFPLEVIVADEDYHASGIFIDLPSEHDLVDRFATPELLLDKREQLDEYGWRNYGELYADHEAVNHMGPTPFVSHYNNQYDGLAGLYRKFFATGNAAWGRLAADLACHVRDIDCYHTDLDREEYNSGLFWHTDHYLDAGLSTHRSCSREHLAHKDPRFCGGGPGAEHCYTTGLLLHYFQTGNPDFKTAVIDLAEWELLALTGPQTVLAAFKRGTGYLNLWRYSRGERRLFPQYPLTRGTGNAITACLDAYEAGGGRSFLDRAGDLLRHTLHPMDDLGCRDLLNAEIAWSYTVLLAAVAKFMDKKQEHGELDAAFNHARASLLAYAEWMAQHEYPYLDKPDILEYPNETWAAQDIRKSVVFYQAARYAETVDQRTRFLDKARFFFTYAENELPRHATSSLTRPLVLMLQNGWVGNRLSSELEMEILPAGEKPSGRPTPYLTLGAVLSRIAAEVLQALGQTSIKREIAWLRARL